MKSLMDSQTTSGIGFPYPIRNHSVSISESARHAPLTSRLASGPQESAGSDKPKAQKPDLTYQEAVTGDAAIDNAIGMAEKAGLLIAGFEKGLRSQGMSEEQATPITYKFAEKIIDMLNL